MRSTGELRSGSLTTPGAARDEGKERIRHREWRVDKALVEHHRRVPELVLPVEVKAHSGAGRPSTESLK